MLTVFNRRKLITVWSVEELFQIKNALYDAGIPCSSDMAAQGGSDRARQQFSCISDKYADQYRVYVHKNDYDRAQQAIQSALNPRMN